MSNQDHILLLVDKLGVSQVQNGIFMLLSGFMMSEIELVDGDLLQQFGLFESQIDAVLLSSAQFQIH